LDGTHPDPAALRAALDAISPAAVEAHLRFLSHPLLEGRAPGTRGGTLALEYIRAQLRRIGLDPAGAAYLQPVPIIGMIPSPELALHREDGPPILPV